MRDGVIGLLVAVIAQMYNKNCKNPHVSRPKNTIPYTPLIVKPNVRNQWYKKLI